MFSELSPCKNSDSPIPFHELSWFSQPDDVSLLEGLPIPVHAGYRPALPSWTPRRKSHFKNNITIKRDNRYLEAMSLPTFSVYNMRSLWSKLSSLAEDMSERSTDFTILAEVWEQRENLKH